jgi:lysozyme family protein
LLRWPVATPPEAYEETTRMDARRPEQVAADAAETEATVRYLRQRQFVGLLDDAIAHAEAVWRLETALQQQGRDH